MEYHNIDGTGWPDAVVVDNGGDIFEHTYETRVYFPVDRDALLALADELGRVGYNDWLYSGEWEPEEIARRIRKALGVGE